jgi:hypothetical protein
MTLEGTAVLVTSDVSGIQAAKIRVHRYITGSGAALVTVEGFGPGSLCLSNIAPGQHALFFIEEASDGTLSAFYLTQFDATAPADATNLQAAVNAAGHDPALPDASTRAIAPALSADSTVEPIAEAAVEARTQANAPLLALAGGGALACVAAIAMRRRV